MGRHGTAEAAFEVLITVDIRTVIVEFILSRIFHWYAQVCQDILSKLTHVISLSTNKHLRAQEHQPFVRLVASRTTVKLVSLKRTSPPFYEWLKHVHFPLWDVLLRPDRGGLSFHYDASWGKCSCMRKRFDVDTLLRLHSPAFSFGAFAYAKDKLPCLHQTTYPGL